MDAIGDAECDEGGAKAPWMMLRQYRRFEDGQREFAVCIWRSGLLGKRVALCLASTAELSFFEHKLTLSVRESEL